MLFNDTIIFFLNLNWGEGEQNTRSSLFIVINVNLDAFGTIIPKI